MSHAAAPTHPAVDDAPTSLGSFVRSPWFIVLASALALALRKPWALHTPQFWAEDGSVFLTQDDLFGARVIFEPYNGYLHLVPRLIAWTARHLADVAWWPALYNGCAFALSVALFARLASPRIELPAKLKPWLILALPLVVGTGEPLINVTNLQWIAALFLVGHLFLAPASSLVQRCCDLAILVVIGLNGPFAIALLPLFAWRAWRIRNVDAFAALGAIGLCAVVQATLLLRSGSPLGLEGSQAPFRPLMFASILGSRLVTWPLFGPAAVRAWPTWVHAALAVAVIVPLLIAAFRRGPFQSIATTIAAAFLLLTLACAYRIRADTWPDDNLVNGDRYFYLSRVLLTWLLILHFASPHRWLRHAARLACLLGLLTHAPHFIIPAPRDYHWAEHCDPIRRGVPGNINTLPEGWWIEYPGRPQR